MESIASVRTKPFPTWCLGQSAFLTVAIVCLTSPGRFSQAQTSTPLQEAGAWSLETVTLRDGTIYRGFVQSKSEHEWELVEVVQPPGRAMHLVIRPVDPHQVATYEALDAEGRSTLAERIDRFRHRSRIEAGRMERVELDDAMWRGVEYRRYSGSWFTLLSATDDETTRRCVVRVEQIFRAYRHILPPLTEPTTKLQIVVFGSMDAYRGLLRTFDLEIDNLAFYAPGENLIVAGSELDTFAQQLRAARARNDQVKHRFDALDAGMHNRLIELRLTLRGLGYTNDEVNIEIGLRQSAWDDEYEAKLRELVEAARRNEAHFDDISKRMFTRLYHEALHAYIENYLFPCDQFSLPAWTNEGLAQLFESGRLESDILRFDAPLSKALVDLQKNLKSDNPLPLAQLLLASHDDFLITSRNRENSPVVYAHAWGLVYYLTHNRPRLSTESIAEYLADPEADPYQRFQQLVGMPLDQFETQWHAAMLELRPAR